MTECCRQQKKNENVQLVKRKVKMQMTEFVTWPLTWQVWTAIVPPPAKHFTRFKSHRVGLTEARQVRDDDLIKFFPPQKKQNKMKRIAVGSRDWRVTNAQEFFVVLNFKNLKNKNVLKRVVWRNWAIFGEWSVNFWLNGPPLGSGALIKKKTRFSDSRRPPTSQIFLVK